MADMKEYRNEESNAIIKDQQDEVEDVDPGKDQIDDADLEKDELDEILSEFEPHYTKGQDGENTTGEYVLRSQRKEQERKQKKPKKQKQQKPQKRSKQQEQLERHEKAEAPQEKRKGRMHSSNITPKQKKMRRILLLVFLALLAMTVVIVGIAVFSTNVYQDDGEFKTYADKQFREDKLFEINGKTEKVYEYGTPISYAADYDVIDNKEVNAFRQKQIDKITSEYKAAQESAEAQRAEENKDNKRYKAPAEALIRSSASYQSGNGAASIVIRTRESQEQKKDMVDTTSSLNTYLVSEKTGSVIYPEQMFVPEYRTICAEYFAEYIKKEYKSDQLAEGWESHVTADAVNFNKFIVSEKFVTFFFDPGTILKDSKSTLAIKVSKADLKGIMRDQIAERYIDPDRPMVALTYDDGPGDASETKILDCLEQNGAVATFFYTGSRATRRPDQVKRAKSLGCEMGNHSWNHPQLTKLSADEVKEQITKTNSAVEAACGSVPTVFRPCYGATNDTVNSLAQMPVIMWSIDTLDWKTKDAQKTFDCIKSKADQGKLDGKIVLMHSIHEPTADATEMLIPWLKENGYQLVTVSELIKYKRGENPQNGKIYY